MPDLYNPNDTITGRPDGVYLDLEEARIAENERARREGRKPEDKFVPYVGTQAVTGAQLLAQGSSVMIPSEVERLNETTNEGRILAEPFDTIPATEAPDKFIPGDFLTRTGNDTPETETDDGFVNYPDDEDAAPQDPLFTDEIPQ